MGSLNSSPDFVKSVAMYDINYDLVNNGSQYQSKAWKALMEKHQLNVAHPAIGWIQSIKNPPSIAYTAVDKKNKTTIPGASVTQAYAPIKSFPIFAMNGAWLDAIRQFAATGKAKDPENGSPLSDADIRQYLLNTANSIGDIIQSDANVAGMMTDFEPPLPQPYRGVFHVALAKMLAPQKSYAIWAGQETFDILPGSDDTVMLNEIAALNPLNNVIIPMYDRGSFPPDAITPQMYGAIAQVQLGNGSAKVGDAQNYSGIGADPSSSPWGGPFPHPSPIPDAYPNPMLPCPHSHGFLARIIESSVSIKIWVGLPFKCSTSEWLFREGVLPGGKGNNSYYPGFMRGEGYKYLSDTLVQNISANSMADYVKYCLTAIDGLSGNETWKAQFSGVFVYALNAPTPKVFEIKDDQGNKQAYQYYTDLTTKVNEIDPAALALLDQWPG